MKDKTPKLSVIVPFYNAQRFIRASILSLLNEDISFEIIAVNDGSSDRSLEQIVDLPIKVMNLDTHKGQAAAQNRGIQEARGDYLCFFDSDDLLVEGGLKLRLEYLQQRPNCNAVLGKVAALINDQGNIIGDYYDHFLPSGKQLPDRIEWKEVLNGLQAPSPLWLYLFRTAFIKQIGSLDERYLCAHDNDYLHRILKKSSIDFIPVLVAKYRLHEKNQSRYFSEGNWKISKRAQAEKLFIDLQYRKIHL